ncbi:hypothetical protein WOLCODRAFT_152565 [Wolfiporia cocos MD-104 SS10]|uniref:Uncharacterized protein n=1 Tax=Wolfiporia cocos (strain MD-104) TaxID=742152 RepID=A0A2H3JUF7_WOLCO|nr:hypothetical protein WOLCODRAFT_152565 [Wolfiporia cocos MD-104 SS10]
MFPLGHLVRNAEPGTTRDNIRTDRARAKGRSPHNLARPSDRGTTLLPGVEFPASTNRAAQILLSPHLPTPARESGAPATIISAPSGCSPFADDRPVFRAGRMQADGDRARADDASVWCQALPPTPLPFFRAPQESRSPTFLTFPRTLR